jgi:hypothetical protein
MKRRFAHDPKEILCLLSILRSRINGAQGS